MTQHEPKRFLIWSGRAEYQVRILNNLKSANKTTMASLDWKANYAGERMENRLDPSIQLELRSSGFPNHFRLNIYAEQKL